MAKSRIRVWNSENIIFTLDKNRAKQYKEEIVDINEKYVRISNNAFERNLKIKEVVLPDTLVLIGKNAFKECKSLKKYIYQSL